jgi:hypothetical protein
MMTALALGNTQLFATDTIPVVGSLIPKGTKTAFALDTDANITTEMTPLNR